MLSAIVVWSRSPTTTFPATTGAHSEPLQNQVFVGIKDACTAAATAGSRLVNVVWYIGVVAAHCSGVLARAKQAGTAV